MDLKGLRKAAFELTRRWDQKNVDLLASWCEEMKMGFAERPRCRHCGAALPKVFEERRAPDGGMRREVVAWGFAGRGFFCTISCGYNYAVARLREEQKITNETEVYWNRVREVYAHFVIKNVRQRWEAVYAVMQREAGEIP